MSAIGQLTSTILTFSRAGLGIMAGYGIVKMIKGRSDEDAREFSDGLSLSLVGAVLICVTVAVKKYLS